jgi:NADH-quinone oxidoreductase subunit J
MGITIAFWILAVVAVGGALLVVLQRNVFRTALTLVVCFLAVAGIFVTLSADFLAAIQILVYVGAVAVLIILGIMLTRDSERGSLPNKFGFPAFITALLLMGFTIYAVTATPWQTIGMQPELAPTVDALGLALFDTGGYLLAVEIAPILLLAAVIGAIVLVREK